MVDAGRRDLNRRLSDLENSISPDDIMLLQFSSRGVEVDGQNYLLPTDVPKAEQLSLAAADAGRHIGAF